MLFDSQHSVFRRSALRINPLKLEILLSNSDIYLFFSIYVLLMKRFFVKIQGVLKVKPEVRLLRTVFRKVQHFQRTLLNSGIVYEMPAD